MWYNRRAATNGYLLKTIIASISTPWNLGIHMDMDKRRVEMLGSRFGSTS
jgi:hypothetical protein